MTHREPLTGDEIDLFEVLEVIWRGKVILAGFVVFAMAIGAIFYVVKKPEYVTQARFEIILAPPFLERNEIEADISRTFFNASIFARWKAGSPDTALNIDLIDQKKIIDGADFEVPVAGRLVSFEDAHIKIKSNDTQLIFEVLDYFEFVGVTLSEKYVADGKKEQSRFENLEKRLPSSLDSNVASPTFKIFADLDRYLDEAVEGTQMLLISRPLPPKKTSIPTTMLFAIAIILGGVSGLAFLLFRKAYQARKLRLAGLKA